MSIDASSIMPLVPLIGGVVTWAVFSLLMYACIRNVDKGRERSAEDAWWDDEESTAERRSGKHLS